MQVITSLFAKLQNHQTQWFVAHLNEDRVCVGVTPHTAPIDDQVLNQPFNNHGAFIFPVVGEGLVYFLGGAWPTTGAVHGDDIITAFNSAVNDAFISNTY